MQQITDIEQLNTLQSGDAVFMLFGSQSCSVCQSIKPQLESLLELHFPDMKVVYIDCKQSPDICAQHSVFTLPVVKAYIDGMKVIEEARAFSLTQLIQSLKRPYTMWNNQ